MGCTLSKAAGMEWSWLKRGTVCAADGRSGLGQAFEAQFSASCAPRPDSELQELRFSLLAVDLALVWPFFAVP